MLNSTMHGFDVEVATKYGLEESVIIHNFQFWLNKNYSDCVNRHDDKTWTYNTTASLAKLFPYMTARAIRYAIDELIKKDVLVKGNYNKAGYDRTSWYAFIDEKMWLYTVRADLTKTANGNDENGNSHLTKTANGNDENGTPIPDSKQQIVKQIVNTDTANTTQVSNDINQELNNSKNGFNQGLVKKTEKTKYKKFVIPTVDQLAQHIADKNYNVDPDLFIAHYTSNGWMVGKNKMKCWKSALITWEKKSNQSRVNYDNNQTGFRFARKPSLVDEAQLACERVEARERREKERHVN